MAPGNFVVSIAFYNSFAIILLTIFT